MKGSVKQDQLKIEQLCTRHRLLSRLSGTDRRRMARKMQVVSLSSLHPLYEMSGVISNVFFPLSAVLFFLGTTLDGQVIEVGQIGSEGIAGVEVAMGTPCRRGRPVLSCQPLRTPLSRLFPGPATVPYCL